MDLSPLRYPGGKTKLAGPIIDRIKEQIGSDVGLQYREPFVGGAGILLGLLLSLADVKPSSIPDQRPSLLLKSSSPINSIWINDKDIGIACLWTAVMDMNGGLEARIMYFEPTVEAFYSYKEDLINLTEIEDSDEFILDHGFEELALHQISYSGLGTKSGGPLGGRNQKPISSSAAEAYNEGFGWKPCKLSERRSIDQRWEPARIIDKLYIINDLFKMMQVRENKCTSYDFTDLIDDDSCPSVIYLDPPYFDKGAELYQHSFTEADHIRLMESLRRTNHRWILSYDDCREIRELYGWATIEVVKDINYSINTARTKSELIIYPR